MQRTYVAIHYGIPHQSVGKIETMIGRDDKYRIKMKAYPIEANTNSNNNRGKSTTKGRRYACSRYAVIQACPRNNGDGHNDKSNTTKTLTRRGKKAVNASVLLWRLHTGRTHQIRVHAAHIGHPIIGDDLYASSNTSNYSKKSAGAGADSIARPALHAKTLGFIHPRTGEEMMFTAELPEDMKKLIEELS